MSQFIFPPLTASLDSEASDGASSLPSKVMVIGGWDGANVQAIKTDAAGDLQIDVGSITPGTGATDLGKAIQSAQGTTDTGVAALVVRNDTLADLSGADGDYTPLQVNATGALYTTVDSSALPTGAATSALQTAGNNLLTTIDADTSSLAGAVSGTEMQVDVVASLPAGTNVIGSVNIVNSMTPVDFLDAGVFDASTGTNIPSTGSATLVTLAADCKEIEVIDDIGEYMSLRVGGAVKAYLPLGGGRVKCHLSTGNAVTLYSETGTTINSGKIAMNFLA